MSQNQRMRTSIELLARGSERILRGWTQHAPAKAAQGSMCGASEPAAIARCAAGAPWYAYDSIPDCVYDPCYRLYLEALAELRPSLAKVFPNEDHGGHRGCWNDVHHRTQADAVRLYDVTITPVRTAP